MANGIFVSAMATTSMVNSSVGELDRIDNSVNCGPLLVAQTGLLIYTAQIPLDRYS
jgi:hypothetical protein